MNWDEAIQWILASGLVVVIIGPIISYNATNQRRRRTQMDDQLSLNYWLEKVGKLERELERLNGRRCDGCKHGKSHDAGDDSGLSQCRKFGEYFGNDHYCKDWEAK
jgi:hypothetical protein